MRFRAWVPVLVALTGILSAGIEIRADGPRGDDGRWLPERCGPALELALELGEDNGDRAGTSSDQRPDGRWNAHYRASWSAQREGDLDGAERSLCQALDAARSFGPRDMRFAETLDELGLVAFRRGDLEAAEAFQGAAVAEMILALGPPAPGMTDEEVDQCRSSVASYLERLGWIYSEQGRPEAVEPLRAAPFRVLGLGYVPLDGRLDWLISRYLLAEDLVAADWLTGLGRRARGAL